MAKHNKQTIAVVIPCYNESEAILKCLEAVYSQKQAFDEVIVVDNNSTDDSVVLIKQHYPKLKLLHEKRQGVVFARNTGFDAVRSDLIARIDVDTYLPPDWTMRLSHIFEDDTIEAVSGPVFYTDMPGKRIGQEIEGFLRDAFSHDKDAPFLWGANMAIRRRAWRIVRADACVSDKKMHEDVDLAIHLAWADLRVVFDKSLVAGASSRRLDDDPIDFYKYLRMNSYTYEKHGIRTLVGAAPIVIYSLAYPGLKLLRRAYDPALSRLSLDKLLALPDEARKNPMA